ncbi:retention module-containing protein [Pseudomonas borbori]
MATLIGIVSQVVGEVYAVSGDGLRRLLGEGDRVFAGEQIVTGASGAVAIALNNGQQLTVGRDSSLMLDAQLLAQTPNNPAAEPSASAPAPSDAELSDVEQLQAAIAAGVDPSLAAEATAAGPGAGAGGAGGAGGGHSFVLLDAVGGALDPVIGFPTEGLSSAVLFPDPDPVATPEPAAEDSAPQVEVVYRDFSGQVGAGPALVEEQALDDGSNPDSAAEQASGAFVISSPNGVASLQVQGFDGVWVDVTAGGVVVGQYGILNVDAAGNWTYSLTNNTLDHGNPNATGAADQVGESFAVRVFDLDGDVSPPAQLNVLINDDGPLLLEGEGAQVAAVVDEDETVDGISDGDGVSNVATGGPGALGALVNFGADGLGGFGLLAGPGATAALEAQGLSSGGSALSYSVIGNLLTASAGAETIFTLQVGGDGSFSFSVLGQLDHPTADGNDDERLAVSIDFSSLLNATDGDGDALTGFNAGSFVIDVEDDVPVLASRGEGQGFIQVRGEVQEDALVVADGAPHEGNPEGGQSISASGAAGSLSALVDFGADGPGSFALTGDLSTMTLQGLSSGGVALSYSVAGNVLTASAGGATVFSLTVSADGAYQFILEGPLDHPLGNGDDGESLPALGVDFSGVLSATDGDGDPLLDGFRPGSFVIAVEDDVPLPSLDGAAAINLQVQEDALTLGGGAPHAGNQEGVGQTVTVSGGAGALFGVVAFGADGPGAMGLSDDVTALVEQGLTSAGVALSYAVVGDVLSASANGTPVFSLTVNDDGSYTFILSGPLDHPLADAARDDETLAGVGIDFSQMLTATDGDGDPLTLTLAGGSFAIDVEDDVPVAREVGQRPWVGNQVDEDELSGGISDGDGVATQANGAAGALHAAINFGADGPGSVGLSASPSGVATLTAQNLSSGGIELTYSVVGNLLTAMAGATPVFTLQVNADGSYSFDLLSALDHPLADGTPAGDNEQLALPIDFSALISATDGDGDPLVGLSPGSFVIQVEDDIPLAVSLGYGQQQQVKLGVSAQVDEDELSGGITDGDSQGSAAGGVAGTLNALVNFGADGPGAFGLSNVPAAIGTLEGQGLTSGGAALSFAVLGNVLTASAGAATVFTLQVNADGSYSFNLLGALDHPLPGSDDDGQLLGLPIDFSGVLTAVDGDGDPVNGFAAGSFVVQVEDDVPLAQNDHAIVLAGEGLDFNVAFVLDFSGSIDNGELDQMLDAVRAAGQALFEGTSGEVSIQLVAFSGTASAYPLVTDFAAFSALLESLNPADGGTRPFSGQTDFTAAIETTMAAFTPLPGASNQVFFISDGNPNEQTGTGGNALSDATASAWNGFVDSHGIHVTALGIGNGINSNRLQDVDLDGVGTPILVANFADLVDTLLEQVSGGLVNGNLLLGSDNAPGVDDDAFGADGPGRILSIEINGVVYDWDGVVDGDEQLTAITTAEGGKLSFNFSSGAWSYQAAADVVGDRTEQFDYVIVDNDGDPASATLHIHVEGAGAVEGYVDEDDLPAGIGDADSVSDVVSGNVATLVLGPDAGAQFSLSGDTSGLTAASAAGVVLVYSVFGNTLTATAGPLGAVVFILQVASDGSYSFNLKQALDHPLDGSNDGQLLTLNFTSILQASDGVAPLPLAGEFLIHVEDDIPLVDAQLSGMQPSVLGTQDAQTIGANLDSASSDFSGAFSALANHGADGPGAVSWNYALKLLIGEGGAAGLSSNSLSIKLYQSGDGTLIGSTANSEGAVGASNTIFSLSVSGSGQVTLNQYAEIDHAPAGGSPYDAQQLMLGAGLVALEGRASITDYDGDSHSDTALLDLGGKVAFADDGPSISLGFAGGALPVLNTQDAQTIDAASDSHSQSFSGAFSVITSSFGADGAGSVTTSYALTLLTGEGSPAGLSSNGATLYLYEQAGVVIASTSATEAGVNSGNSVFSLSVTNTGQVTLVQHQEIDHGADAATSLYGNQEAVLASNLVGLRATVTITDGDGDSASADKVLDLGGKVAFDDDGPSISLALTSTALPVLNTQDGQTIGAASDSASANFAAGFVVNADHGADGPGLVQQVYSLGLLAGPPGGPQPSGITRGSGVVLLYKVGNEIVGSTAVTQAGITAGNTVFSLAIDSATGVVTLTQLQAITHALPGVTTAYASQEQFLAAGLVGVKLQASISDGDDDLASAVKVLDLGGKIAFDDDGPSTQANPGVLLDDDALANGIAGGTGDGVDSLNASGTLGLNYGADGAGSVQWLTSGAPLGFSYHSAGTSLLVNQGSVTVLTVTLNATDGSYSVTQNAPILHGVGDQENNQAFTLTYRVTDQDGDSATGSLSINVDDDTPQAFADSATVVEDGGKDFNVAFVLDSSGSISNSEFTSMLNAVKAAGQALFNGTSGEVNVTVVAFSSDAASYAPVTTLAAFNALIEQIIDNRPFSGQTDFTAAIEETLDAYSAMPGWSNQVFFISDGNPNQQTGTAGNSLSDATAAAWNSFVDSNGVSVTAIGVGDGINLVRLQDVDLDGSGAPILLTGVDELIDTLLEQVGSGDVSGNVLLGNDGVLGGGDDDGFGADGAGQILSIEIDGVLYTWDGVNTIDASVGADVVGSQLHNITTALGGSLSFDFATGNWAYNAPQSVAADSNEVFVYTLIDRDGDTAQAQLTVAVEDVAPEVIRVDEDELAGGISDHDSQTTVASGDLSSLLVGTGSAQFSLNSTPTTMPALTSDGVAVTYQFAGNTLTALAGATAVFTLVVQTSGAYTFTLLGALDHPGAAGDDEQLLVLDLSHAIKASDGTNPLPLAGALLVQVENDVPAILASTHLVYANDSNPAGGQGLFVYSTGADSRDSGPYSAADSDFTVIGLSGTVGGGAITGQSVTWVAEDASSASFSIEFSYAPNPLNTAVTAQATGSLVFDKVAGTYSVALSEPITGFEILKTSASLNITGYNPGTSTPDSSNPVVAVSKLDDDFYVQFRSYAEPGSGTGGNNLQAGSTNSSVFANGELFSQAASYVTVSNSANGVAGDTIGQGEVLDLNFFTSNPFGNLAITPDGRASGMYLKLDGVDNSDDLVVVLKLVGAGGVTTTRALVVGNSDIYRSSSGSTAIAALAVYGIVLDNNDGAIVIEHNDFNAAGENWQIYGAQVLATVEGITTAVAINYDRDFGESGASTSLTSFSNSTDSDVIKVSDVGLIVSQTQTLDTALNFQVAVRDADNDATSSVTLQVTIEAGSSLVGSASADVLQGSSGDDSLSGLGGNDSLIGGAGDDILIGGEGSDTFVWNAGDRGGDYGDVVADFNTAAGDKLDLSQLLVGVSDGSDADELANYLSFAFTATDTVISVSSVGTVSDPASIDQTITLENVLLSGGVGDAATIIEGMLSDQTLAA